MLKKIFPNKFNKKFYNKKIYYDAGQFYLLVKNPWLKSKSVFTKRSMIIEIKEELARDLNTLNDLSFLRLLYKNKKKLIINFNKIFYQFKSRFTAFFRMKLHTKNIFFAYNIWKKIIFKFSEKKEFLNYFQPHNNKSEHDKIHLLSQYPKEIYYYYQILIFAIQYLEV